MDPGLRELIEGDASDEVEAIVRLLPGRDPPPRVRIIAQFGDIATCRLPRARIAAAWADNAVVSLKAPRLFGVEPDPLPAEWESDALHHGPLRERRPGGMPETGRDIVVGVIDWGFDFAHPNFRNADGTTRVHALWDQSASGPAPDPYGYGRVFRREEIDRALAADDPYGALGYHPASGDPTGRGAHGTHVLDIAAGNGRATGSVPGLACEADLCCVHLATRGTAGRANLGDSVTLLEAVHWIAREASDRPFVINLSVGRHGGPHHGLTLVEQGIDALLAERAGCAVVQSCGNYFEAMTHASGTLRPGQVRRLSWWTEDSDLTPNELEVWYPGSDVFAIEFTPPDGSTPLHVPLGADAPIECAGREVGRIYHRAKDPGAGDNHLDIFLYADAPAGRWSLSLGGEDVVDGRWHVWVERDAGCAQCQSRLDPDDSDPTSTTGTIANGFRAIAVGAYDAYREDRPIAPFSSCGPTRDGRTKPDLVAPGVTERAARSAPYEADSDVPLVFRQSGTSMAAPHVTGAVALIFEAAGRPLEIAETRRILLGTAELPTVNDGLARWGSGYLDVEAAVTVARRLGGHMVHALTASAAESEHNALVAASVESHRTDEGLMSDIERDAENDCGCQHANGGSDREASVLVLQTGLVGESTVVSEDDEARGVVPHEAADAGAHGAFPSWMERPVISSEHDLLDVAAEAAGSPTAFVERVLDAAAPAGAAVATLPASAAAIFDAIVMGGTTASRFAESFEVIAAPGERLSADALPGDILVRRALGEGSLATMAVLTRESQNATESFGAGEQSRPGRWARVIEPGAPAGRLRFLAGEAGRLPMDQLLLRPVSKRAAELLEAVRTDPSYQQWIQQSLNRLTAAGLSVTGNAGPATTAAVRAFQRSRGLVADGIVGPKTERALVAAGASAPPDATAPALGFLPSAAAALAACAGPATTLDQFVTGRSDLTPVHRASIATLADAIVASQSSTTPVERVCIVGHTDSVGAETSNATLGQQRAAAVEAEMRSSIDARQQGLPAQLAFASTSAGESAPVASNATAPGRARNRRVEVALGRRAAPRVCPRPAVSADDPGALDLFPVSSFSYPAVTGPLPGFSGTFTLRGTVFYPADSSGTRRPFSRRITGRAPIVFMAHGNHGIFRDPANRSVEACTNPGGFLTIPNHEGYDYFQRALARMGIIAVSVDCNETNCQGLSPTNIHLRSALIVATILRFQGFDATDPIFRGRIDFSRCGLFGHSRGGEAVLAAANVIAAAGAPGTTVRGVLSLAPTDRGATNGIPQGFPFLTILPAADGDVVPNSGARFYDQAIPGPFKSQLYIDGANHNFFNRQWVEDEGLGPNRPSRSEHEHMLLAYGCAFLRSVLLGHDTRRFLEGLVIPSGVPLDRVHVSFELDKSTTIDDHENRNIAINRLGQPTTQASGMTAAEFDFEQNGAATFNGTFFGKTVGMVARSSAATGRFRSQLGAPVDLTGHEIWIRAAEVYDGTSVPAGATGCVLALEDAGGNVATVDTATVGGVPRPYDRRAADLAAIGTDFTKTILTTLRFHADCFTAPGFDLTRVTAVQLRMNRGDGRALAFDQLQIV